MSSQTDNLLTVDQELWEGAVTDDGNLEFVYLNKGKTDVITLDDRGVTRLKSIIRKYDRLKKIKDTIS